MDRGWPGALQGGTDSGQSPNSVGPGDEHGVAGVTETKVATAFYLARAWCSVTLEVRDPEVTSGSSEMASKPRPQAHAPGSQESFLAERMMRWRYSGGRPGIKGLTFSFLNE